MNVSPVYKSVKHNAAKSVNRSILKKSRHIGFGVLIVHSSMIVSYSISAKAVLQFLNNLLGLGTERNRVFVLARQATQTVGFDSLKSIHGLLKSVKIWALGLNLPPQS